MCGPSALLRELRLGELVDRLAERLGSETIPRSRRCSAVEVVEVRLHRLGQLVALLDPLEAGVQQRTRRSRYGLQAGIRAAELGAGGLLGAGLVERDPDQRRAVALRPGDVDRRLEARHEPLVAS